MAQLPRAGPAARTTQPPTTTAPPAAERVPCDATSWWLSTERMIVCVDVDARGIIVAAPPIARRFIGRSRTCWDPSLVNSTTLACD